MIRFFHVRPYFAEKGGVTFRVEGDVSQVKVQYAECSLKDNYSRKIGRERAAEHKEHFMPLRRLPGFMDEIVSEYERTRSVATSVAGFDFATKYFLPKE